MKCAIKIIQKREVQKSMSRLNNMISELQVLEEVSQQNIVKVIELLHDDNKYYIVTELAQCGDLFSLIE